MQQRIVLFGMIKKKKLASEKLDYFPPRELFGLTTAITHGRKQLYVF